MTLAAYNARRKALTRLERIGWLNHRLTGLSIIGKHWCCLNDRVERIKAAADSIRAYRAKHKFWECR